MNLNLAPSPFPMEQTKEKEHDHENQETFTFGLNHHHHHQIVSPSSSSSASCHIFFNQAQDHTGFFHPQLYQPHHHPLQDDYYSYHGGSSYEIENKVENGLKLSLWKKEDESMLVKESSSDRVKWMPRLMKKKKKKKKDGEGSEKLEEKKVKQSSSMETDLSSNSSSYNCSTPIRVCSDCHTTKTPLWRSGPKGPKSLCNACGIRQRKARRAMAMAAAGEGGGAACDPVKVKVKMGKSGMKKRCKSGGELEEFLIKLSEKLAIHRVFPQDEKEAAILLMALSSGLVHG